jgi:HD superfamily phosphohydrolase
MAKDLHEIRDPIHNFIRIETGERKILDSRPFQRLWDIHQLACVKNDIASIIKPHQEDNP